MKNKSKQRVSYWWDFACKDDKINSIEVESDIDSHPVIAVFPPNESGIKQAEKLISDLKSGRISIKKVLKNK